MDKTERLPIDELAQLNYDSTIAFFSVAPLLAIIVLAVIAVALYFWHRVKNWNEIGEAMRFEKEEPAEEHDEHLPPDQRKHS